MPETGRGDILSRAFEAAWRLAILALPWQTRWFSDASLAGWPWEQGRVSVYVSWGFLLSAIVLGFLKSPDSRADRLSPKKRAVVCSSVGLLFLLSLFATSFEATSLRAASQWWAEAVFLGGFVLVLRRNAVPFGGLARWFLIAMIPQFVLGSVQFFSQQVSASKILGIASQFSSVSGVSVVEAAGMRFLRIYGGFPHPNLFGGWMALSLLLSVLLVLSAQRRAERTFWTAFALASSFFLFHSFSRSAWLAAAGGFLVLTVSVFRGAERAAGERKRFAFVALSLLLFLAPVFFLERDLVLSRSSAAGRLEGKSLDERKQSLVDARDLFLRHPWIGTGPNAELAKLAAMRTGEGRPFESPHSVPVLVLVNLGILGAALLMALVFVFVSPLSTRGTEGGTGRWSFGWAGESRPYVFAVFILPPLLLDHYLWSYWSGKTLAVFLLIFAISYTTADKRLDA